MSLPLIPPRLRRLLRQSGRRAAAGVLALAVVPVGLAATSPTASAAACLAAPIVSATATENGSGYWLAASDGGVFAHGSAGFYGSAAQWRLNKPVVEIVRTASGKGYWLVAADGGVFAFGDAHVITSNLPHMQLNQPVVGAARSGRGLVLTAGDGGMFAIGGASFHGSAAGLRLNKPVVDIVTTSTARGYWLVAADGGVFAYGDAPVMTTPLPSMRLNAPIVGAARSAGGLVLTAADGGVFALGGAHFRGSATELRLVSPVVAITTPLTTSGYWLAAADGGVFSYGAPFHGSSARPGCPPPGQQPTDRIGLAKAIRDNGGITLMRVHQPDSPIHPGSTAWQNIVDTANGGQALRSPWSDRGATRVSLNPRMLEAMLKLRTEYGYTFRVTEIVGADHTYWSLHYDGLAFDIGSVNGQRVNPYNNRALFNRVKAACRALGAVEALGPGDNKAHATHIHCGWPRR